jgi:hypothetical protein
MASTKINAIKIYYEWVSILNITTPTKSMNANGNENRVIMKGGQENHIFLIHTRSIPTKPLSRRNYLGIQLLHRGLRREILHTCPPRANLMDL